MKISSHRLSSESGLVKGAATTVLIAAVVFAIVLYVFGSVVPPGMMGVRQITMGPGKGYSRVGLTPGYHLVLPYYSTIHLIPKSIQVLNFHRTSEGGIQSGKSFEIPTADRAIVDLDVSILSHFYDAPGKDGDNEHGGPADLLQKFGIERASWEYHIQRSVDDQLKRTLGSLETSQFYQPTERDEQLATALIESNKILAPDGIKVESILLRRYTYRAESIDNAIFQKNLQIQLQHLNTAASNFAEAQAEVEQVTAQLDAEIETKLVKGGSDARVLRSEGDLLEAKRKADGDLLVAKARAEVDRLRSSALAQSSGANIYVAREMAPLLGSLRGGIVTDIDPYDVTKWIKRLGVPARQ